MMASSYGNIFRVTAPLCREFTGDRWIPHNYLSIHKLQRLVSKHSKTQQITNHAHTDSREVLSHYNDVIMSAMASWITSPTIVYSTVYSRRWSKKTSKFRVTGLCEGNSPVTGEFPAQRANNAENVTIWWRHHEICSIERRDCTVHPKNHVEGLNFCPVLSGLWPHDIKNVDNHFKKIHKEPLLKHNTTKTMNYCSNYLL